METSIPSPVTVRTRPVRDGRCAENSPRRIEGFETAPFVRAVMGPDVAAYRDAIRPELALCVGGTDARSKKFSNDMIVKLGLEAAAKTIQDFYLDGKKSEAADAVPDALIDAISLCGPAERIKDPLEAWKCREGRSRRY